MGKHKNNKQRKSGSGGKRENAGRPRAQQSLAKTAVDPLQPTLFDVTGISRNTNDSTEAAQANTHNTNVTNLNTGVVEAVAVADVNPLVSDEAAVGEEIVAPETTVDDLQIQQTVDNAEPQPTVSVVNASFTRLNESLPQDTEVHASQILRAQSATPEGPRPDAGSVVLNHIDRVNTKLVKSCKESNTAVLAYLNHSMWIRAPNPSLVLRSKTNQGLVPDPYYIPDIFVWLPRIYYNAALTCPACKSTNTQSDGWPDKPKARRVFGWDRCYYIMSRRQLCKNEQRKKRFIAHDPAVVACLPEHAQLDFPAYLTARSGMDGRLAEDLLSQFYESGTINNLREGVKSRYLKRYTEQSLSRYSFLITHLDKLAERRVTELPDYVRKTESFSLYADPNGYCGSFFSNKFLGDLLHDITQNDRDYYDLRMQNLSGSIIKIDHSFKLPKRVHDSKMRRYYGSLFSIVNEHEQIIQMLFCTTKSTIEIEQAIKNLGERCTRQGVLNWTVYTDNIKDEVMLKRAAPQLMSNEVPPEVEPINDSDLPTCILPATYTKMVVTTMEELSYGLVLVVNSNMSTPHTHVYAFDTEWDTSAAGGPPQKIDLLQVGTDKVGLLIRLQLLLVNNDGSMPKQLRSFLEQDGAVWVGSKVNSVDIRHMRVIYDIHMSGGCDLATYLKERRLIQKATLSLQKMVELLMNEYLPKTENVRCGNWGAADLSEQQINYAALDIYTPYRLYILGKEAPLRNIQVTDKEGSVILYTKSGSEVAAEGLLCNSITETTGWKLFRSNDTSQNWNVKIVKNNMTNTDKGVMNRRIVKVTNVFKPHAALCYPNVTQDDIQREKYGDFEETPFLVACNISMLMMKLE